MTMSLHLHWWLIRDFMIGAGLLVCGVVVGLALILRPLRKWER